MASDKTNVMRVLEQHKIAYKPHEYPHGKDAVDGVSVAELLGQNPDQVFKTLVARGKSGGFHVFVIPVAKELDLKKAAKAAGEKSVEMVHVKELLGLTGYVRGGCSPEREQCPDRDGLCGQDRFPDRMCTGGSHQADTRRDRAYHDGLSLRLQQPCRIRKQREHILHAAAR